MPPWRLFSFTIPFFTSPTSEPPGFTVAAGMAYYDRHAGASQHELSQRVTYWPRNQTIGSDFCRERYNASRGCSIIWNARGMHVLVPERRLCCVADPAARPLSPDWLENASLVKLGWTLHCGVVREWLLSGVEYWDRAADGAPCKLGPAHGASAHATARGTPFLATLPAGLHGNETWWFEPPAIAKYPWGPKPSDFDLPEDCTKRCSAAHYRLSPAKSAHQDSMSAPVANTTLGLIAGTWLRDGTAQYLGLEYATAIRWHEPVDRSSAYAAGGATFDATRYGMSCPQGPGQIYNSSATSEDCLFINVWTPPKRAARVNPSVMLWIHGGAYSFGGGAPFNGSALAAQHGVVVCTINYRLGYLGWLAFPEDRAGRSTTGNWGLLDQQSALRWVQREVSHFGGNPDSVTLFGQSAGAMCVTRHLASPASRGLFHRAIAESGAAKGDFSLDFALTKTRDAAQRLGCAGSFGTSTLRSCLSNRTVAELLAAQANASIPSSSHASIPVSPVVDGVTLLGDTLAVLQRGTVADAPLLIGVNTNEANLFVATTPAFANMSAAQYADFVCHCPSSRRRCDAHAPLSSQSRVVVLALMVFVRSRVHRSTPRSTTATAPRLRAASRASSPPSRPAPIHRSTCAATPSTPLMWASSAPRARPRLRCAAAASLPPPCTSITTTIPSPTRRVPTSTLIRCNSARRTRPRSVTSSGSRPTSSGGRCTRSVAASTHRRPRSRGKSVGIGRALLATAGPRRIGPCGSRPAPEETRTRW